MKTIQAVCIVSNKKEVYDTISTWTMKFGRIPETDEYVRRDSDNKLFIINKIIHCIGTDNKPFIQIEVD